MENAPIPRFDATEVIQRFDTEFQRRLEQGELTFDKTSQSEVISGINNNGQLIEVRRPSLDVETSEAMSSLRSSIKYFVIVTPSGESEGSESHELVIQEDGSVSVIFSEDVAKTLVDSEAAKDFFDGVFL